MSSDELRTTYSNTKENPADILTENLLAGLNRYRKVCMSLFHICPEEDEYYDKTNNDD